MHINTKSMTRILPAISIFTSLAVLGHKSAFLRLLVLCEHAFPRVRSTAAQSVYQVLTELEPDMIEEHMGSDGNGWEEAAELVMEVDWCEPLDKVKPVLEQVRQKVRLG